MKFRKMIFKFEFEKQKEKEKELWPNTVNWIYYLHLALKIKNFKNKF